MVVEAITTVSSRGSLLLGHAAVPRDGPVCQSRRAGRDHHLSSVVEMGRVVSAGGGVGLFDDPGPSLTQRCPFAPNQLLIVIPMACGACVCIRVARLGTKRAWTASERHVGSGWGVLEIPD